MRANGIPRIVRVASKVIGATLGLFIALLLVWFGFNLFDQPLSAGARAILAVPPDPYPAKDNVYVALVGFDAPAGSSIITVGQERIEEYERSRDRALADGRVGWVIAPSQGAAKLKFKGGLDARSLLSPSVWAAARSQSARIAALTAANQELYQRYLSLHGMQGYFESGESIESASGLFATTPLRSLFLANIAARIRTGTPSQQLAAAADLEQDLRLWKIVLDGTGGMLAKMAAAQALHADLLLAADMVTDPGCDLTFLRTRGDSLLTPFSLQSWNIGNAYEVEMRWEAPVFAALPRGVRHVAWPQRATNWFSMQFFEPHATENLYARRTQRLRALAEGDPASYLARRDAYDAWARHSLSPASFYNPVGRILMALSTLNEDFPAQVYDVAAFQRLVFLAYQLRLQHVPFSEVAKFMAQHPEWSTHPVGGVPFRWQPASGRIEVLPVAHEPPGRIFALTLRAWPVQPGR